MNKTIKNSIWFSGFLILGCALFLVYYFMFVQDPTDAKVGTIPDHTLKDSVEVTNQGPSATSIPNKNALERPDIVAVGDSNTEISYFNNIPEKRWTAIVGEKLNAEVINFGKNGHTTKDFLIGYQKDKNAKKVEYLNDLLDLNGKYYIICFGLNDARYYSSMEFEAFTRQLIYEIQTKTDGIPILMTNVAVDYPNHFEYDRNKPIKEFDDVKRKIAKELNIPLIDIYKRFVIENKKGNWDTRIRTTKVLNASQDKGKPVRWYSNIHYNIKGNQIVAEEIVKYFNENALLKK